jgi:hypothetical protein
MPWKELKTHQKVDQYCNPTIELAEVCRVTFLRKSQPTGWHLGAASAEILVSSPGD